MWLLCHFLIISSVLVQASWATAACVPESEYFLVLPRSRFMEKRLSYCLTQHLLQYLTCRVCWDRRNKTDYEKILYSTSPSWQISCSTSIWAKVIFLSIFFYKLEKLDPKAANINSGIIVWKSEFCKRLVWWTKLIYLPSQLGKTHLGK